MQKTFICCTNILPHPCTPARHWHKAWKHFIKKSFNSVLESVTIVQTEDLCAHNREKKIFCCYHHLRHGQHKFFSLFGVPFMGSRSRRVEHTLLTFSEKEKRKRRKKIQNSHGNQIKLQTNKRKRINSREHKKCFKRNRMRSVLCKN